MKPFLSLDIETTGLDRERSEVLEIGAILEDGVSPLGDLKIFHTIIKRNTYSYCEPYAMQMNQHLLQTIAKGSGEHPAEAYRLFRDFINFAVGFTATWDSNHNQKVSSRGTQVVLGGKNVAGFDIPILRNDMKRCCAAEELAHFDKHVYYSVIDPGSMYLKDFGRIPGLGEIKKLIGIGDDVSHRALDDAFDVIKVVRHKLGIPF